MCCAKEDVVAALDTSRVGVFAFSGKDGAPRACAVTPYVDADRAMVSSTLAFPAKVAATLRDPRVAILAGGCLVRGHASVEVDLSSNTFDERVRAQELRKYPPSRLLLRLPGHRRLLPWYVGRATVTIPIGDCAVVQGPDRVTLICIEDGLPRIVPLDPFLDLDSNEIPIPTGPEGAACVLVHDEDEQMNDLRQLTLHGSARNGVFRVERRSGSVEPSSPSTIDQLRMLRRMAREARRHRPEFQRWAQAGTGSAS